MIRSIQRVAHLLLVAVCSAAFFVACSSGENTADDRLPRETFKNTLLEAQLIEARLHHEMIVDKRMDMPVGRYYEEMLKEQGVSEEAFKRTFDWYTEHPEELKTIYAEILVELQRRGEQVKDSAAH